MNGPCDYDFETPSGWRCPQCGHVYSTFDANVFLLSWPNTTGSFEERVKEGTMEPFTK